MAADMKTEHHNGLYPRTDSLPHDSSTPRNKKDGDGIVVTFNVSVGVNSCNRRVNNLSDSKEYLTI